MESQPFEKFILGSNIQFEQLSRSCEFEEITKGRKGGNLIHFQDNLVPLVRTTTSYSKPAQQFGLVHYEIITRIRSITNNNSLQFNNALIELYDKDYRTMGYHSDQALDLASESYIGIYSLYADHSDTANFRKLKIRDKILDLDLNSDSSSRSGSKKKSNAITYEKELVLDNDSFVIFSTATNRTHQHKIVLESQTPGNLWCGITFRLSKTFINFRDSLPYFFPANEKNLRIATDEEKKEFYKERSKENSSSDHNYGEIEYTISPSDLMMIK
jgi:hypothetical protein